MSQDFVRRDFEGALLQLNAEKGVSKEILLETLEQAIAAAYRRSDDAHDNVVVKVDRDSGKISVFREKEVVASPSDVTDPELQMAVTDAQKVDPQAGVVGLVRVPELVSEHFGRVAAQYVSQV